jgi:benzil reductase ((S)-benzoin forming)
MTKRLAIVTGSTAGLGAGLCDTLRAQGFDVLGLARRASGPWGLAVDLGQPESAVAALRTRWASLDLREVKEVVVVLCAATLEPLGPAAEQSETSLLGNLQVNLLGPVAITAFLLRALADLPARKVIAHVGSGAADRAHPGLSAYGAAKAGMRQFMQVVAAEQQRAPHPILAVEVDPGALDTAMQAQLRASNLPSSDELRRRHAVGELGSPLRVAALIVSHLRDDALAQGSRWHLRDAQPGSPKPLFTPH